MIAWTVKTVWTEHQNDATLCRVTDDQRTSDPVGDALTRNLRRIRDAQRVTFVELAARLTEVGRPIPVLGLRRIEQGQRRVDVGDLLALSVALRVHPVDLLVPGDAADDEPYAVAPEKPSTVGAAREWIAGRGFLQPPADLPAMAEAIRHMPKERAQELMRQWWTPECELENNRQVNRMLTSEEE